MWVLLATRINVFNGSGRQVRQNLHQIPTFEHHPWIAEHGIRLEHCRNPNRSVVFNVAVRRVVGYGCPEIGIKAAFQRSTADGLTEIDGFARASRFGHGSIGIPPVEAEMPLANTPDIVPVSFEQLRHRESVFLD